MSWLWLSLSIRQVLRTLGQHRAILPMLVIAILTIPTAIVAVDRMAPHAHTIFHRLGPFAAERLIYGFALLMGVLLFPIQLQLLQELDASREIENLERYPIARRSLFHFKLIDQWVVFLPLLVLALGVAMSGGLFHLVENRREFQARLAGRGSPLTALSVAASPPLDVAKKALDDALDRAERVAIFHSEIVISEQMAAMRARGDPPLEVARRVFIARNRAQTMLAEAADRVAEATISLAEKRPVATQVAFALALWEDQIAVSVRERGAPSSLDDLEPPSRQLWHDLGLELPLGTGAQLALAASLVLVAIGVQLALLFAVTFAIGLVPDGAARSRGLTWLLGACVLGVAILALLFAIPGMRRAETALTPLAPWSLVARAVGMVQRDEPVLALVPLALFAAQLVLLYELAGYSYRRNMLEQRERINARVTRLMSQSDAMRRGPAREHIGGWATRWLGDEVGLLVAKDVKQITRPPINRLMIAMLGLPFGGLATYVGLGMVVGAPSPYDGGAIGSYGLAAMLLAFYGLLTLFWIPCTQIFLFGYERWGLTLIWFGPVSTRELYRAKAVAAGLVITPAVAIAYLGMAMFIGVGGSVGVLAMTVPGVVFVGVTAYVFGHIVAGLGILFPYYLQTRFRHLAGGMGFLMQLSLVPAWVATWIFGVLCARFFGLAGGAILVVALAIWTGFARILSREATQALDRIGVEFGRSGGEVATPAAPSTGPAVPGGSELAPA